MNTATTPGWPRDEGPEIAEREARVGDAASARRAPPAHRRPCVGAEELRAGELARAIDLGDARADRAAGAATASAAEAGASRTASTILR